MTMIPRNKAFRGFSIPRGNSLILPLYCYKNVRGGIELAIAHQDHIVNAITWEFCHESQPAILLIFSRHHFSEADRLDAREQAVFFSESL